ncbi:hypothetical protein V3C99_017950 [Haemonchus contortus]|uniref:HTH_Tnp_Tc3_2 domain-containing protein n=1 Tax=Haemonchus contortus TaxID=6289 RepID=A0A7I4Z4I8_HAECO
MRRVGTRTSLLTLQEKYKFLHTLITGDEKWVLCKNPVRKRQWVNKGEEPQSVPKPDIHPKKVFLSCWWSRRGIEHWELPEEGQTINAITYDTLLKKLNAQGVVHQERNGRAAVRGASRAKECSRMQQ